MTETHQTSAPSNLWVQGAIRLVFLAIFFSVPLFLSAGTLDWSRGWILLGVFLFTTLVNLPWVIIKNPELIRERWKRRKDTKPFDKLFGLLYVPSVFGILIVGGLGVRYGWSSLPLWTLGLGIALHLLGSIPILWTLLTNTHAETTVRLQDDRDHTVCTTGPYRFVRHPMYVGILVMFSGWPLILGSPWALILSAWLVPVFVFRTAMEDKTLRRELPGYEEFTQSTRYRLVPGVW